MTFGVVARDPSGASIGIAVCTAVPWSAHLPHARSGIRPCAQRNPCVNIDLGRDGLTFPRPRHEPEKAALEEAAATTPAPSRCVRSPASTAGRTFAYSGAGPSTGTAAARAKSYSVPGQHAHRPGGGRGDVAEVFEETAPARPPAPRPPARRARSRAGRGRRQPPPVGQRCYVTPPSVREGLAPLSRPVRRTSSTSASTSTRTRPGAPPHLRAPSARRRSARTTRPRRRTRSGRTRDEPRDCARYAKEAHRRRRASSSSAHGEPRRLTATTELVCYDDHIPGVDSPVPSGGTASGSCFFRVSNSCGYRTSTAVTRPSLFESAHTASDGVAVAVATDVGVIVGVALCGGTGDGVLVAGGPVTPPEPLHTLPSARFTLVRPVGVLLDDRIGAESDAIGAVLDGPSIGWSVAVEVQTGAAARSYWIEYKHGESSGGHRAIPSEDRAGEQHQPPTPDDFCSTQNAPSPMLDSVSPTAALENVSMLVS